MFRRILRWLKRRSLQVINAPIRRSHWYKNLFLNYEGMDYPNDAWYRKNYERNFDFMILGSSMAFWGVDMNAARPRRGVKLSRSPQYLMNDYRLLKNYFSIVRHKGTIIVPLSPFSSVDTEENGLKTMRYLKVFQNPDMSLSADFLSVAKRLAQYPILLGKPAIRAGLKVLLRKDKDMPGDGKSDLDHNTLTDEQLCCDAKRWIDGWMRQFRISDLSYPLTEENEFGRARRLMILRKIIDFCAERELRPVLVYLPVSRYLRRYFSDRVREIYVDSFIGNLGRDVEVFNYLMDDDFNDEALYFNSFFLNRRGSKLFTARMMRDVFGDVN